MTESQKLMAPLETITNNLKTVSTDLAESGKLARDEMVHVQQFLGETQQNIREQIVEIRSMVLDTVDEARTVVMRPVREYSAIASAVAAGVRTFFSGRKKEPDRLKWSKPKSSSPITAGCLTGPRHPKPSFSVWEERAESCPFRDHEPHVIFSVLVDRGPLAQLAEQLTLNQ